MTSETMKLINFDNAIATNHILQQIGILKELGEFLGDHLTQVLRNQHSDVVIQSIEFVGADPCSAGGMPSDDNHTIHLDSLSIPIRTRVLLMSDGCTHDLTLLVTIIGESVNGQHNIKTDVIIERQSIVESRKGVRYRYGGLGKL